MIHNVQLTLEVTCDDGTVIRIPAAVTASAADIENARLMFQLGHSINSADLNRLTTWQTNEVAYDEELLRVLVKKLSKQWEGQVDKWPDGSEPEDIIERLAVLVAGNLRFRGAPPPP